jgi:hypothetical protein
MQACESLLVCSKLVVCLPNELALCVVTSLKIAICGGDLAVHLTHTIRRLTHRRVTSNALASPILVSIPRSLRDSELFT